MPITFVDGDAVVDLIIKTFTPVCKQLILGANLKRTAERGEKYVNELSESLARYAAHHAVSEIESFINSEVSQVEEMQKNPSIEAALKGLKQIERMQAIEAKSNLRNKIAEQIDKQKPAIARAPTPFWGKVSDSIH